jgi:hypothetical protein
VSGKEHITKGEAHREMIDFVGLGQVCFLINLRHDLRRY